MAFDKKAYAKQWRIDNAEHIKQYSKSYYEINKALCDAKFRTWYEENGKEYNKTKYAENRKELAIKAKVWREANPEKQRDISIAYKKRNADKVNHRNKLRYANKINALPLWANKKYIELFYTLAKVEERRTGHKVHVDHIVPLKGKNVCGLHCEHNLQLLFAEDNIRKSNSFGG